MHEQYEQQQQQTPHDSSKKKERTKLLISSIVIFLVVIGVILLLTKSLRTPTDNTSQEQERQQQQASETALAVNDMEPIEYGQFLYQFEDIAWQFESASGENETRVNMMFEKFSRRDNVYVTFGEPYKLGTYTGTCQEAEMMEIDPEREPGIALAFAECWSNESGAQIAVFQEGHDVVIKNRYLDQEELDQADGPASLPAFNEIYRITLTEVVR